MARLPRLTITDQPQHIIQRGNNRQATFFAYEDYTVYLDKLHVYAQKYEVDIHAYVLMTNHVHLLMTPRVKDGISKLMQALGRYYVRYINKTYQRSGTLWEGRYKSTLVDSEHYLLTVMRYIELNPVRAEMVKLAEEYPWSSYHANALGKDIKLITGHAVYHALGKNKQDKLNNYVALFDVELAVNTIDAIRTCTNRSWVLGSDKFKQQIEAQLQRRVQPSQRGGDRKSKAYREKTENQLL